QVYAYILGGEIAGTAVGFIISSSVASLISWRAAFLLLAIPRFFPPRELYPTLPGPPRGGQSRLEPGVVDLHEAAQEAARAQADPERQQPASHVDDVVHEAAKQRGVSPDPRLVLSEDPRQLSLGAAVRYILSIPTNILL